MLARDYRVIPLDELLRTPDRDLPPRAIALTFDDGYLDNLEYAAPVLERAGLPATFFLTSGWLGKPGEYWWDTLERVLLLNESVPPSIDLSRAGAASSEHGNHGSAPCIARPPPCAAGSCDARGSRPADRRS